MKVVRKTKTLKKTALIALIAVFLASAVIGAGGAAFAAEPEEVAQTAAEAEVMPEQRSEEEPAAPETHQEDEAEILPLAAEEEAEPEAEAAAADMPDSPESDQAEPITAAAENVSEDAKAAPLAEEGEGNEADDPETGDTTEPEEPDPENPEEPDPDNPTEPEEPTEPEPDPTINIEKIEQVAPDENGDFAPIDENEINKWSNEPVYFEITVKTTVPIPKQPEPEPEEPEDPENPDGGDNGNNDETGDDGSGDTENPENTQIPSVGDPGIDITLNNTSEPSSKLNIEYVKSAYSENSEIEDENYIYTYTYVYKFSPKDNIMVNSKLYVTVFQNITIGDKPEFNLTNSMNSDEFMMFDTQIPAFTLADVGRDQAGKETWKITGFNQNADSVLISAALKTAEQGAPIESAYIVVSGVKAELKKQDGTDSYLAVIPFTDLKAKGIKDGDILIISEYGYANEAGFESSSAKNPADNIPVNTNVYYCQAPIAVVNLKFAASNTGSNGTAKLCRETDKLTLTFSTNHPTEVNYNGRAGCVMIAGQVVPCEKTVNGAKCSYYAEYAIPEGGLAKIADDAQVTYSFTLTDAAGNTITKTQEDTPAIVYYAPLSKTTSGLSFLSDNENDAHLVKVGNTLTLKFKTNHPAAVSDVSIAGAKKGTGGVSVKSADGGLTHTITYVMPAGAVSDNTDIEFTLNIKDNAGNTLSKNQDDLAKIRYYAPIEIHDLKMVSNNQKTPETVAKDGNALTLTFYTTHPVTPTLCEIAGKPREITSEDGMHWTAVYTVSGSADSLPDTEVIKMKLILEDAAGNDKAEADELKTISEPVKYYAPIVVSDVDVSTSNTNGTTRYAKDGDRMTVRFTTNHETEISNAQIGGRTANQSVSEDGIARRFTMETTVPNGVVSDLSNIGWNFTASDVAGNDEVAVDQSRANNQIQYFRPITSTASVRSDNLTTGYAKNGDTVTVSVTANHPVSLTSGSVGSRSAGGSGGNSAALTYAYTIPQDEASLSEGELPVSYAVRDAAGNVLNVNGTADGSKIIYDRTAPELDIKPLFNGFTNDSVTYTVTYADDNLDPAQVSLTQNGLEQISASDISGNSYTKEVTLEDEDRYELAFTATDRAGNSVENAAEFIVTIDRTAPEIVITSAELKLDQAKTFPGGFVISEYFGINEIPEHLETIDCTLTDAAGQKAWDINEPIMQEGKTSMLLTASDKAGNTSVPLIYEFYIDATAPRPIIRDELTGRTLAAGENAPFIEQAEFAINLEALEMGDETPDTITKMVLLNENGEVVDDVLASGAVGENLYRLSLPDLGLYKLMVSATDSVGNVLEDAVYEINVAPKPWYQAFFDNKPLFYSVIIGAAAAIVASVLIVRARRLKAA